MVPNASAGTVMMKGTKLTTNAEIAMTRLGFWIGNDGGEFAAAVI
jgi:hypothetical protein